MATNVIYVGLDAHKETIEAEWGMARRTTKQMQVRYDEDGIQELAKAVGPGEVWAVYEASSCGFVLYDQLTRLGWRVSVVAPTRLRRSQKDKKRKTDRGDARALWELLAAHGELGADLPAVWIPDEETRMNREVTRRRLNLGERISGVKAGIRSLLQMHGVTIPKGQANLWTAKGKAWLQGVLKDGSPLRATARAALASELRELDFLEKEADRMYQEVEALAATPRYAAAAQRMRKLKGVGGLTAMVYLLELGDPKRFRNRRQVGSYLGVVPSCHESGTNDDRKGHITKMGPGRVRKVLNQAAWTFMRYNPGARSWFEGVKQRRGTKIALVGLMRKLSIMLWRAATAA